ncbi:MAG: hypothetical protein U0837_04955 [Dehalococcoidia bacterium]
MWKQRGQLPSRPGGGAERTVGAIAGLMGVAQGSRTMSGRPQPPARPVGTLTAAETALQHLAASQRQTDEGLAQ